MSATFKGSTTSGGGAACNANTNVTWAGGPPQSTDSIVVFVYCTTAVNDFTGVTDSAGNTYTQDYSWVDGASAGHAVYRATNISGAPTYIRIGKTSTSNICFVASAFAGLASGVVESVSQYTEGAGVTAHSIPFTTTNNNDLVMMMYHSGADIPSPTNLGSWAWIDGNRNATDVFYLSDAGAAGSYNFTFTGPFFQANMARVVYKSAVTDPTVSTVTQTTTSAEGGSSVHTVTLSGPTNRSTDFTAVLSGVTADVNADLSNTLQTATIVGTGGAVTFVGTGNNGVFRAASGVTSFTVTLSNTQDLLNENNETYTLTVSGVSGTGTIIDDDVPPIFNIGNAVESFGELLFDVSLNTASGKVVTVDCATSNGAKTSGVDYQAKSVTIGFNPGDPLSKKVAVSTRPAPAAPVLRFASPYNNITEANSVAAATTYLSVRARVPFLIGSGDLSQIVLAFGAWNLFGGTINYLGNAYSIVSCAIEKDGGASAPVTFSASRSAAVADGTAELLSDALLPSAFGQATFVRGTKFWIRVEYSVAAAALKLPRGKLTTTQWGTGASGRLLSAGNDCSPVDGTGAMTSTVFASTFTNPYVPIVLGKFVSGDPKTFIGIGDSIMGGYLDDGVTYPQKGSFSKALTDADFVSNPIAGANFGYTGSDAALWTGTNSSILVNYLKYAKYAVDEYQTNKIAATNGNLAAAKTGSQALWSLFAANGITVVLRTKLNPRCANGTDGTITFGTAWSTGGDALAFNDWLDTVGLGVAQGVTLHVLAMFAIRLSQTQSTESFYRWLGATNLTLGGYTSDGTHPNAAGHVLQAANYRAAFGVLN